MTKARTTHSHASKETVAEDAPAEAVPPSEPETTAGTVEGVRPDDAADSNSAGGQDDLQPSVVMPPSKGMCVNHPTREAVLVVTRDAMPWLASDQRFCNRCIPDSYRSLM